MVDNYFLAKVSSCKQLLKNDAFYIALCILIAAAYTVFRLDDWNQLITPILKVVNKLWHYLLVFAA